MPARVAPGLQAKPTWDGRFHVGCVECKWYPDPYFAEDAARSDAEHHNDIRHNGASVDFTAKEAMADIATMSSQKIRCLRRQMTISVIAIVANVVAALTSYIYDQAVGYSTAGTVLHAASIGTIIVLSVSLGRLRNQLVIERTAVARRVAMFVPVSDEKQTTLAPPGEQPIGSKQLN